MNRLSLLCYKVKSIGLYREAADSKAVCALTNMLEATNEKNLVKLFENWGRLICELYQNGESTLSDFIYSLLLKDNNAFSRACASKEESGLFSAAQTEISTFAEL